MTQIADLPNEIEGTWDEIAALAPKFNGHRLRVTIVDDAPQNSLSTKNQRAIAYLQSRLVNESTDDPEEIRQAQEELDDMKRSMNEERLRSGAKPIF